MLSATTVLQHCSKALSFQLTPYFGLLTLVCLQGLLFLLYPLLGHLADVYLTRYRTLKCGVVVIIAGEVAFALSTVILVAYQAIQPLKYMDYQFRYM